MITTICVATFGDAFVVFDFAIADKVSTILIGHYNSPPFGY